MANPNPNLSPSLVPPVPIFTSMVDAKGLVSNPWSQFFQKLLDRLGGISATTNATILADISVLQANVANLQAFTGDLGQGRAL